MDMVKKENECKIIDRNGYPVFSFRGEELAPVMFRSFRPTPANISLFARAGVRISQIMVSGQMNGMNIPMILMPLKDSFRLLPRSHRIPII